MRTRRTRACVTHVAGGRTTLRAQTAAASGGARRSLPRRARGVREETTGAGRLAAPAPRAYLTGTTTF